MLYLVRRRWEISVEAGRTPTRFPVTLGSRLPVTDVLLAIPLNEFFDLCLRRAGFRLQSIGSVNLG